MKVAVFAAAVAGAAAWEDQINHPDNIAGLNSVEDTWVAGKNEFFEGVTYDQATYLLGADSGEELLGGVDSMPQKYYDSLGDVPAEFDSRTQWGSLIAPIRDQQRCGSCWAFSAVETLTDRFSIAKNTSSPVLSAEDIVACDKADNGCSGGRLPSAWSYLEKTGVVSDKCLPYTSGSGTTGKCQTSCTGSGSFTKYKAKSSYAVNGVENMQKEIMTNGPIQVAFKVYRSFMSYKSGVYQKKWYELVPEGGHAVKIVGWGTENGVDYWLVANSWNTTWGLDGFFKIKRGGNQCGIEKMGPPYAGMPAV